MDEPTPPVEGPDAPSEDTALVRELLRGLSEEDEQELVHRVLSAQQNAIADRSEWESRLAEWEDAYYNRVPDKTFPWVGASNFHIPITMMGIETFKPRLIEGVLGQRPPIFVLPSKGADESRKDIVEAFLNWQDQTELDVQTLVTQSAHLYLQPGIVIAKTYWKVDRTLRRAVREFPPDAQLEDVLKSLFDDLSLTKLEAIGSLEWEGEIGATAQTVAPATVRLKMHFLERGIQVLIEREEVVEKPAVELLDPIDFMSPARAGQDVAGLPWCQHRMWLYEEDLRDRARSGR